MYVYKRNYFFVWACDKWTSNLKTSVEMSRHHIMSRQICVHSDMMKLYPPISNITECCYYVLKPARNLYTPWSHQVNTTNTTRLWTSNLQSKTTSRNKLNKFALYFTCLVMVWLSDHMSKTQSRYIQTWLSLFSRHSYTMMGVH